MKFTPAPIFEIVRLIDIQPPGQTGFCMLVGSSAETELINELRDELSVQINSSLAVIDVTDLSPVDLVERVRTSQDNVLLMQSFDTWKADQFRSLDVNRSRLETGAFLVFRVDFMTAGAFLNAAPNLRSFLGTNIFAVAPDDSAMGPQEIAERLDQLRSHYGLTDADVIRQAASGELPPEPHFIEWLVLIGRSELVR